MLLFWNSYVLVSQRVGIASSLQPEGTGTAICLLCLIVCEQKLSVFYFCAILHVTININQKTVKEASAFVFYSDFFLAFNKYFLILDV